MRLFLLAVVLLAACREKKAQPGHDDKVHREQLERSFDPLRAAMEAPAGATPCETGWNAMAAFIDARRSQASLAGEDPFKSVPTKEDYLEACRTLPEHEQVCVQPRFQMANQKECNPIAKRIAGDDKLAPRLMPVEREGAALDVHPRPPESAKTPPSPSPKP